MSVQTIANKPSLIQHLNNDPGSGKVIKAFAIATFIAFCFLLGVILMSSVMQKQQLDSVAEIVVQSRVAQEVSPRGFEAIEYSLRNQFMTGDWRFADIKRTNRGVDVYVQIPAKLAVTGSEFDHYVRHSICPKQTDAVWNDVRPSQLNIRLFTDVRSLASNTRCG